MVYVEKPVEKVHKLLVQLATDFTSNKGFEQVVEKVVEKVVYVEKPADKVKGRNRNRHNKMQP